VSVINIIGIDNPNKIIYGIGNNKKAYMRYKKDEKKWYSISQDTWQKVKATLPVNSTDTIKIEDDHAHESNPEPGKQREIGNGEIWGG
jgi:hypothetical protein